MELRSQTRLRATRSLPFAVLFQQTPFYPQVFCSHRKLSNNLTSENTFRVALAFHLPPIPPPPPSCMLSARVHLANPHNPPTVLQWQTTCGIPHSRRASYFQTIFCGHLSVQIPGVVSFPHLQETRCDDGASVKATPEHAQA